MKVFCANIAAALRLVPHLSAQQDRDWYQDRLNGIDTHDGDYVIEIDLIGHNNKGTFREGTFFIVRTPSSVRVHKLVMAEDAPMYHDDPLAESDDERV